MTKAKRMATEADNQLRSIRLEKVIGIISLQSAMEIVAHSNRKLWMVPAMKAVFAEEKHPVTGKMKVTKMNMDNFLSIEFYPLEEDLIDPITRDLPASGSPAPEVNQDAGQ